MQSGASGDTLPSASPSWDDQRAQGRRLARSIGSGGIRGPCFALRPAVSGCLAPPPPQNSLDVHTSFLRTRVLMTYTFKLARRIARLRAPLAAALLVALSACDSSNSFDPDQSSNTDQGSGAASGATASAYAGGIPFGMFAMPDEEFGTVYNGAMQNNAPQLLLQSLAQIKARGGKVAVMFAGQEDYYKEGAALQLYGVEGAHRPVQERQLHVVHQRRHDHRALPDRRAERSGQLERAARAAERAGGDGALQQAAVARHGDDRASRAWLPGQQPPIPRRRLGAVPQPTGTGRRVRPTERRRRPAARSRSRRGLQPAQGRNAERQPDDRVGSGIMGFRAAQQHVSLRVHQLDVRQELPVVERDDQRDGIAASSGAEPILAACRDRRRAVRPRDRRRRAPSVEAAPVRATPPSEPPTPTDGVPFGPIGVPTTEIGSFTGGLRGATPENVLTTAAAARQAGAKVVLRLSGGDVSNANGTFSLTKWKAAVDRYARVNLGAYIADGTIAGHMLVQNPANADAWGGQRISYAHARADGAVQPPALARAHDHRAGKARRGSPGQPVVVAVARRRGPRCTPDSPGKRAHGSVAAGERSRESPGWA